MPGEYAAKTDVPVSRSRDEIEGILNRFGATAYGYISRGREVAISFEVNNIRVLMRMVLPDRQEFKFDSRMRLRTESAIERSWEQACRQRWRSLANGIKAKLALVDDGISTVEREFLADIWVPGTDQTYGQWAIPQIAEAYERNDLPPMLPGTAQSAKIIALGDGTRG